MAAYVLQAKRLSPVNLQVLLGHACYLQQYRRETASLVDSCWTFLQDLPVGCKVALSPEVRLEILKVMIVLPLLVIDLRSRPSGIVTVSDVSEEGGGACRANSFTQQVRLEVLRDLG